VDKKSPILDSKGVPFGWVPIDLPPKNGYEARLTAYPAFAQNMQREIDALYGCFADAIAGQYANVESEPLPARWSRRWWRSKWYSARKKSAAVRARRRVGLWIGGISPSELECDC
jgi:hypothetical protein